MIFIAWVPLLLVEDHVLNSHYRSGKVFIHAYLAFFIFNIGSTWWVWNASAGGAVLAIVLNSLFMTLAFYAYHLTKKYVGHKEGYLSLPIYWIAYEYFHHNWEMSWTWLSMGNYFSITPAWVQWYSYTGIFGGTLWILIVNLMVYRIYQNRFFKGESWRIQTPLIWTGFLMVVIPISISIYSYFSYEEKGREIEVVALQPNIDPYDEKFVASLESQLTKLIALAEQKVSKSTDIVIAPETAISTTFNEEEVKRFPFFTYLVNKKITLFNKPWLIGASTVRLFDDKHSRASQLLASGDRYIEYYNTSLLIDDNNQPHFIHKSKLVPGVEIIPFSNYFPFLEDLAIDNGGTSVSLGVEAEGMIFQSESLKIAPVVCYESVYGDWVASQCRKGAEFIAVITNDGWWGDTPGYKQHMSFARLRAIENRRSVVRSANTGISCFIDQRGDVSQETGWWVPAVIKGKIKLNEEVTFYTIYGDVIGRSLGFVSIILLLFMFVKRFKSKYSATK